MPLCPESYDDVVNATAALLPAGSTIRLYSALADPVTGPLDDDELPADGGYAPAVTTDDFSTSTGGEARASVTVDFGTSTGDWPETAIAWKGFDPDGVPRYFELLQAKVEVDEAGTPVPAELDIYYRPADGA